MPTGLSTILNVPCNGSSCYFRSTSICMMTLCVVGVRMTSAGAPAPMMITFHRLANNAQHLAIASYISFSLFLFVCTLGLSTLWLIIGFWVSIFLLLIFAGDFAISHHAHALQRMKNTTKKEEEERISTLIPSGMTCNVNETLAKSICFVIKCVRGASVLTVHHMCAIRETENQHKFMANDSHHSKTKPKSQKRKTRWRKTADWGRRRSSKMLGLFKSCMPNWLLKLLWPKMVVTIGFSVSVERILILSRLLYAWHAR